MKPMLKKAKEESKNKDFNKQFLFVITATIAINNETFKDDTS